MPNSASNSHRLKLTDKLRKETNPSVSFEYFPPRTDKGLENLYVKLQHMKSYNPAWVDITWGAGGSTANTTFDISNVALNEYGIEVMVHLTCTNVDKKSVDELLVKCKQAGLRNIMALRGDPPANQTEWVEVSGGFAHAIDLVKHIREQYGDYFCIGVAGYPEGHPDCSSMEDDLRHLKEKVEAGADMIVTQLFYDNAYYFKFVESVRGMGISVPIYPGVMPITTYKGFKRMTEMCHTNVPKWMADHMDSIQDDETAVRAFGVRVAVDMCNELLDNKVSGLHLYTLNQDEHIRTILAHLHERLPNVPVVSISEDYPSSAVAAS